MRIYLGYFGSIKNFKHSEYVLDNDTFAALLVWWANRWRSFDGERSSLYIFFDPDIFTFLERFSFPHFLSFTISIYMLRYLQFGLQLILRSLMPHASYYPTVHCSCGQYKISFKHIFLKVPNFVMQNYIGSLTSRRKVVMMRDAYVNILSFSCTN